MSFQIALSGLHAIDKELNTISNNIANSETGGFKASRVNFQATYAGTQASGVATGKETQSVDKRGTLKDTGDEMDVAINGKGFFALKESDGSRVYSRVGNFEVSAEGFLAEDKGRGRKVQGYRVENGVVSADVGDIKIEKTPLAPKATEKAAFTANLDQSWVNSAATMGLNGLPTNAHREEIVQIRGADGKWKSLTQHFVKTADDTVAVYYELNNRNYGPHTLTFNATSGALTSSTLPTPPATQLPGITIDYSGTTLQANAYAVSKSHADGYEGGQFTRLSIEANGDVQASYSNGEMRTLGKLAIAQFSNVHGLVATHNSAWRETQASGVALMGQAGVGAAGELQKGMLEGSNTNVTDELVKLMSAQRNYQANTKVISTQNEMVRTLMQAM